MRKLTDKIKKSESFNIFRGMLTMVVGSSVARILGIVSMPFLTRLYSPEDYGVLALYISVVSILVPISTLKYSTAIPLPKTDVMAMNLLVFSFILIGVISLLLGFSLFYFGEVIFSWFGMIDLAEWWWLVMAGVIGSASYEVLSLWSLRKKEYKIIAITLFIQELSGNSIKIILGMYGLKPFGLLFGHFIAQSSGVGNLIKNSIKDFKRCFFSINKRRIAFVASYYREFAYFRLPSQILLNFSSRAPIIMMAVFFTKEATGQLSLAMTVVSLPVSLIGNGMSKAFYAEIAAVGKRDIGKVKRLTIELQKKLFLIGIPLTAMVMLLAEPLFETLFGKQWVTAGSYASILAPFILLQFTSNPLLQVLNIIGSQLTFLIINVLRFFGLVVFFIALKSGFDVGEKGFVMILVAYLASYYLIMTFFIISMVNKSEKVGDS